jgi:hypothetical protein
MNEIPISTVSLWGTWLQRGHAGISALLSAKAHQRDFPRCGEVRWLASPTRSDPIPLFMACWHFPDRPCLGILAEEVSRAHSDALPDERRAVCPWERRQFEFLRQQCAEYGIALPEAQLIVAPLVYCEVVLARAGEPWPPALPGALADQLVIWNRFLTTEGVSLFEAYCVPDRLDEVRETLYELVDQERLLSFHLGRQ